MSIDKKVDDLIAALDRNTSALLLNRATATATTPAAAPAAKPTKPAKPAKTEEQLAAETLARVAATEAATEAEETGATKEQAGEALNELLKANKKAQAIALLKKFGAASLSGIPADKYGEFIEQANDVLLSA